MKKSSFRTALSVAAVGMAATAAACTPVEETEDSGSTGSSTPDGGTSSSAGSEGSGGGQGGADSYAAGDYTATGTYTTPGGEEQIGVSLTLDADGTISALSVEVMGVNPNSKQFQGQFAGGIADVAVGQNIAELSVDKVAGSSLSSGGFNAAIDAIEGEAAQA